MVKIDNALFKVFERIVDKWVLVTGKSNFKLAYLVLVLAAIGFSGFLITLDLLLILMGLCILYILYGSWLGAKELEKQVGDAEGSGVMPAELEAVVQEGLLGRVIVVLSGPTLFFTIALAPSVSGPELWTLAFLPAIGMIAFGAFSYIVLIINPGGKSVFQRAKEKLKNFSFEPVLQPVPVRG